MDDSILSTYLSEKLVDCKPDVSWKPILFDLNLKTDRTELGRLFEVNPSIKVNDNIKNQLGEYIATLHPSQKLAPERIDELVKSHLEGEDTRNYGTWVYYPWASRLVHLLPELEFRSLRTNRNRNKISGPEQEVLRGLTLGVVGLSVGQATALTLAQEEVGGQFRLADFDTLDLSNLNRLRAPTYNIGLPKTVLTARGIYEINPYADVRIYSDGINSTNIEEFLVGDGKMDILFEECDGLDIKIQLREAARRNRIPVLMETSDRGMLDVERFDLEPERPILHGLVQGLDPAALKTLSNKDKVPIILNIIGASSMSDRMAASLVEVETTVKTWPQLASAVALGGALNTNVARRIALGEFTKSGRYYADFEQIINDNVEAGVDGPQDYKIEICEEAQAIAGETERVATKDIDIELMNMLVSYARLAPSAGNSQPWRFVFAAPQLLCFSDPSRMLFDETVSITGIGAAIENICLVAKSIGVEVKVSEFPDNSQPELVAALDFSFIEADPALSDITSVIAQRVTNRRPGKRQQLDEGVIESLSACAQKFGATLNVLSEDQELDEIGAVLGAADVVRFFSKELHRDLMKEFRWNAKEVLSTLDGLDVATMEMNSADLAGLKMLRSWPLMKMLVKTGGGRALQNPTRKSIAGASAVCRLGIQGYSFESFLAGGRALQRLWLQATRLGLALQPMAGPIYFFARMEHEGSRGFDKSQIAQLEKLRSRYLKLFPTPKDFAEVMVFRLAIAEAPSARALRRNIKVEL